MRDAMKQLDELEMGDLWASASTRTPSHLADDSEAGSTPLARRSSRLPVFAVSLAVLALVAILLATLLPLGDGGKAPGGVGPSDGRYHAPAGWSIVLPPGWHALPFETSNGGASAAGVQLSNVVLPPPTVVSGLPIQTKATLLPDDGVSLIIAIDRDPSGIQNPPKTLTIPTPPLVKFHWVLSVGGDQPGTPHTQSGWFQWNGQTYIASGKVGPRATSKDIAALDAIIQSLRFDVLGSTSPTQAGPAAVPPEAERGAVASLKSFCASGQMSDVQSDGSTTLADLGNVAPHLAAFLAQTNLAPDETIYGAVVTGSCVEANPNDTGVKMPTARQGYVVFRADGTTIFKRLWNAGLEPQLDGPFTSQADSILSG